MSMFLEGDPCVNSLKAMLRKFNLTNANIAPFPPLRPEDLFDEESLSAVLNAETINRKKMAKVIEK